MYGNVVHVASCYATSSHSCGARTTLDSTPTPLVQRRRLRTELRRARAEARLTQDQVAKAMDWSLSKIIRIETGAVGISTNDLRALLSLYGIDNADRTNELIELARASRQPSWWSRYKGDISPQYLQYIEYEESASTLRMYDPLLLPGLLQTEDYAAAVMRALAEPETPAEVIRARIDIRLTRQRLLEQAMPPNLICVIDEAAVQRVIGERNLAHGQIVRLIDLANRPNIIIGILPFSAGLHSGLLEPFIILEFSDPEDSDVLYLESSKDAIFSHDEAGEITGYRMVFEQLLDISLSPADTISYLADLMNRISL
jgi:transcriptional regulator with XRE-family HTH domain